jgi:hypothetical protein
MTDELGNERLFEWPNIRWEDDVKSEIESAKGVLHWRKFVMTLLSCTLFLEINTV